MNRIYFSLSILCFAVAVPIEARCQEAKYILESSSIGGSNGEAISPRYGVSFSAGTPAAGEMSSDQFSASGGFSAIAPLVSTATSIEITNHQKWNIISLPLFVEDGHATAVFQNAQSSPFAYVPNSGYSTKDSLEIGRGYWVKFLAADTVALTGLPNYAETLSVEQGWNLIGSITNPVLVGAITTLPDSLVTSEFFGYKDGYKVADTIEPGRGYWVKANRSGELILSPSAAVASSNKIHIMRTSELPPPAPDQETEHEDRRTDIPREYSLEQAYPNPFNPSSVIRYQLPVNGLVSLKVYDVLGQEVVAVLNDEQTIAGYHDLVFDATTLPSGVYFYRIVVRSENGNVFSDVKKMLLMK